MRAGVGADGQALGHQQPGDHLRRRALAVGAGDVDDRVGELRVAHRADEVLHALESWATRSARSSRSWRGRRGTPARRSRSSSRQHVSAARCCASRSRQLASRRGRLAFGSRGTSVGLTFFCTVSTSIDDRADVAATGQVVHDVEQHLFEDGAQAAGAGAAQQRLVGDRPRAPRG